MVLFLPCVSFPANERGHPQAPLLLPNPPHHPGLSLTWTPSKRCGVRRGGEQRRRGHSFGQDQPQLQQGQAGCAKEEESPSKKQQDGDSQLDTSWNNEEERDGKQGGVTWQEWKQQEGDDQ